MIFEKESKVFCMGYNVDLIREVYSKNKDYINLSNDKHIKRKAKRLELGYKRIIKNDDYIEYPFWSVIHELKTHDFLKGLTQLKVSNDEKLGPDFRDENTAYECVIVTFGKKGSETYNNLTKIHTEVYTGTIPRKDIIFRVTNAIDNKRVQYNYHRKQKAIDIKTPYVLMIDLSLLSSCKMQLYEDFKEMLLPLVGAGEEIYIYNKIKEKITGKDYQYYRVLKKRNTSEVEMNIFSRPDFSFISGIIFSSSQFLKEYNKTNTILMVNPLANNPLDLNLFKGMKAWQYFETKFEYGEYRCDIL